MSDHEARQRALDPARSIILQAPAGSGKTTVLTQRFLRLLCTVDDPDEILAVTFTRKAAAEMRERVMRALQGGEDDSSEHGTVLTQLARAAAARSDRLGWALLSHPARLRIETIDALNRALALRLPLAARGAGSLAVAAQPQTLYAEAARRTLLDAQSHPALAGDVGLLFDRLDNDFARFEELLTLMLGVRAHWLPHFLKSARLSTSSLLESPLPHEQELQLCERIEESLRTIVSERLQRARALIPATLLTEGFALVEAATRARLISGDATAGAWRSGAPQPTQAPALGHWQALAQLALTGLGTWRTSLTRRQGFFPENRGLKERALHWLHDMRALSGARELLRELTLLPEPVFPTDDIAALNALARVLQLGASELEVVFGEFGRVDFPYVAAAARRALTEESAPTELALRLGSRIRHLLVDEFQDTSIEQCALIEALTAGWEAGDGRTLFLVGDPMQSIYQFREAEVGLFLRARTHGLGTLALEPLALSSNFRAVEPLVEWINRVFATMFATQDDPRTSAVRYVPCIAARSGPGTGSVQVHATADDAAQEADAIAALVAGMRTHEPSASIAILLSARPHAAPIVAALRALHLPVAAVELVSLAELPVIRDLTALAQALEHLGDRTAWLAVLRAPWCGLALTDISALIEGAPTRTVWELLQDEARVAQLAPAARARLLRTRAVLAQALAERDRHEPSRWVETTWLRLGGPAAAATANDLEHARAFFEALARWAAEPQWTGSQNLPALLEELYAEHADRDVNPVQIMTIHRAKGLEFDKVIVPGLARRLRADREPLMRWLELPRETHGSDLLMAPIAAPERRGLDPLNEYVKSLQERRSAHERTRLLYVAATRARSELHLFGEVASPQSDSQREPAPPSGTLLATLWPAAAAQFLESGARLPGRAADRTAPPRASPALERLTSDWTLPQPPRTPAIEPIAVATYEPPLDEDTQHGLDASPAQVGARVVRDHLRRCARRGRLPHAERVASVRALRDRLVRLGYTDELLERCALEASRLLEACLADSRLQWIFASSHADVSSPLELTGMYEGRLTSLTVDRSFTDEQGMRWLVEFSGASPQDADGEKFVTHELERRGAETARQLALARRHFSQAVRAAVYFPAVQKLAELS